MGGGGTETKGRGDVVSVKTNETTLFCVNCKHYKPVPWSARSGMCHRLTRLNRVTGKLEAEPLWPCMQRTDEMQCGKDGKYFEVK